SQVCVQDHPGGVDQRPKGVAERLLELPGDRSRYSAQSDIQRLVVQTAGANFLAEVRENDTDTLRCGGVALTLNQALHFGLAHYFVGGRKLLEERRICDRRH